MPSKWKGDITFGLVSIPVVLHPSRDRQANISFHQIDSRDNARIKYKRINSVTGKEVPWEKVIKGYEYDKETTVPVPDDILQRVAGDLSKTIGIETFINKKEFDFILIEKTYYLTPDKKGDKGYVILRESLKKSNKIAIAKVIISTKEYVAAVMPYEKDALILCLLSYQSEMHDISDLDFPDKSLAAYKVNQKEISVAEKLIDSMTSKWKPKKFIDEYQSVIHKWVEDEVNNKPHPVKRKKQYSNPKVVNFVDLLRKSISNKKQKTSEKHIAAKRKPAHRHSYATRH